MFLHHCTSSVYPRWRGEHSSGARFRRPAIGLSPLARGTLFGRAFSQTSDRFIPAGAGNTLRCLNIAIPLTVYPRWRGEHCISDGHC
ncbi:hypothetical protein ECP03048164_2956 [Escherichia coli P0304816.4]|nr:hypothetical protein ECP03048164_2956 [Escherichia coli P0304816.4]